MPPTTGYPSNPGTVEDLHKKCQNIFPMFFEGAKLLVNKALNQNFQVSHTMTMSNMMPSGYRFGATYVGQKMLSPQEAYPLLLADIDPSGNLNANIVHAPTENTRLKVRHVRFSYLPKSEIIIHVQWFTSHDEYHFLFLGYRTN